MNRFMSFWISLNLSAVLFFSMACRHQSGTIYRDQELEPFREIKSYLSPFSSSLIPLVDAEDPIAANPKQVFDFYCSNGISKRSLSTSIRAVLPKPPRGMPIDAAAEAQQEVYQYFRQIVKSYYKPSSYEEKLRSLKRQYNKSYFVLNEPGFSAFTTLAKESRINYKRSERIDWDFIFLISFEGSKTLALGMVNPPTVSALEYSGSEKGLIQFVKDAPKPRHFKGIDAIFPARPFYDKDDNKIFPIYPVLPFESAFFLQHYTMIIPLEIQQKIFDRRPLFVQRDGSFHIGDAIESRDRVWDAYIESQSSIQEAQTDDPQVIDFQVSLNLDLFCRYGRLISDLITD